MVARGSSSSSKWKHRGSARLAGSVRRYRRGSGMRGRRGRRGGRRGGARDPLAQSFFVSEQNGIFLNKC